MERDDLDWALLGLIGALFVAVVVQLLLFVRAMKVMATAVDAARQSAEVAAAALADARLPHVDVENWAAVVDRSSHPGPVAARASVRFDVANFGAASVLLEWVDLYWCVDDDEPGHARLERRVPIRPHRRFLVDTAAVDLRDGDAAALGLTDGLRVTVWGRLHYRAIDSEEPWWRTFGQSATLRLRHGAAEVTATFRPVEGPDFYREGRGTPDARSLAPPRPVSPVETATAPDAARTVNSELRT